MVNRSGGQVQRVGDVERLLDRRPVARSIAALEPVTLDPFRHLGSANSGSAPGRGAVAMKVTPSPLRSRELQRERALAAARCRR